MRWVVLIFLIILQASVFCGFESTLCPISMTSGQRTVEEKLQLMTQG